MAVLADALSYEPLSVGESMLAASDVAPWILSTYVCPRSRTKDNRTGKGKTDNPDDRHAETCRKHAKNMEEKDNKNCLGKTTGKQNSDYHKEKHACPHLDLVRTRIKIYNFPFRQVGASDQASIQINTHRGVTPRPDPSSEQAANLTRGQGT